MAWNGTADVRVINHLAREMWTDWTFRISKQVEEQLKKNANQWQDRLTEVKEAKGKWGALAHAGRSIARKNILAKLLHASNTATNMIEGTNVKNSSNISNQESIGKAHGSLEALIRLASASDKTIQKYACEVLAIISLHRTNQQRLMEMRSFIPTMTLLIDMSICEEVQSSAASILANLAYNNSQIIHMMGKCGVVSKLTKIFIVSTQLDVLGTVSAALINMLHDCDKNRKIFYDLGGIQAALRLCHSEVAISSVEVQANAVELLANATCLDGNIGVSDIIKKAGVRPLVLLCASQYLAVQQQISLVIGNLALSEDLRIILVEEGAVHALLLLVDEYKLNIPLNEDSEHLLNEKQINVTVANSLWALSNIAWSAEAQDQIGLHLEKLLSLCRDVQDSKIQENTAKLIANILYFHEGNRRRMLQFNGLKIMVRLCNISDNARLLGQLCRVLGTMVHNHVNAKVLSKFEISKSLVKLCLHKDVEVQQYAAWALGNLATHDDVKKSVIEAGAIEAIVKLNGSSNTGVARAASRTLDILNDLVLVPELSASKSKFGAVPSLVDMLQTDNEPIRIFAAEELAKETWAEGRSVQDKALKLDGVDALIELLSEKKIDVVLKALWALRNLTHMHVDNQSRLGSCGGIKKILKCVRENDEIAEAAVMALITACSGHEKNCRRLIVSGLHDLIEISESEAYIKPLVLDLLKIIGPYRYILCTKCGWRNSQGKHCQKCSAELKLFVLPNTKTRENIKSSGKMRKKRKQEKDTKLPAIL
eukprot:g2002.t1